MPSTNVSDAGIELPAADDTVRTAVILVPSAGWVVSNTGSKTAVLNVDAAAAPTRTQPVGAGGRWLPPGASIALPSTCASFTYQICTADTGNTTILLVSKG